MKRRLVQPHSLKSGGALIPRGKMSSFMILNFLTADTICDLVLGSTNEIGYLLHSFFALVFFMILH